MVMVVTPTVLQEFICATHVMLYTLAVLAVVLHDSSFAMLLTQAVACHVAEQLYGHLPCKLCIHTCCTPV